MIMRYYKFLILMLLLSSSGCKEPPQPDYKKLFNELVVDINIMDVHNAESVFQVFEKSQDSTDCVNTQISTIHHLLRNIIDDLYDSSGGMDTESFYLRGAERYASSGAIFNKYSTQLRELIGAVEGDECIKNEASLDIRNKLLKNLNNILTLSKLARKSEISLGQAYYLALVIENKLLILGVENNIR